MSVARRPIFSLHAPRRRGAVLVLIIPMIFIFFALAALVIDLGMVRTTQATMTSACDTGALEALRWRDQLPPGGTASESLDENRRAAAAALVGLVFDNNDPVIANDASFAPGPQFDINRPANNPYPAVDNLATILPDQNNTFAQPLSLNLDNASNGDLVSGSYVATATDHQEIANVGDGGSTTYARDDFTPSASSSPTDPSMLVRLRRVRDDLETSDTGIASIWPSLPLLFGRGTAISAPTSGFSLRRSGFTVRATGIANAAPVLQVGLPVTLAGPSGTVTVAPGVMPVGIYNGAWTSLKSSPVAGQGGTPLSVFFVGSNLTSAAGTIGLSLNIPATVTVGDVPTSTITLPIGVLRGYFPILDDATGTVIGFGWAQLDLNQQPGQLTKLAPAGGAIAPWNASANPRDAWANLSANPNLMSMVSTVTDPLLAPVGVRATDLASN